MRMLVAKFTSEDSAESALQALVDAGVDDSRIIRAANPYAEQPSLVQGNPVEVSADSAVSPGAEHSGSLTFAGVAVGSVIGAAAGIVTTPLLGPMGIAAGVGVGAYAGSLVGALAGLEPAPDEAGPNGHSVSEDTRTTLAITPANEAERQRAEAIVRAHGAALLEDHQVYSERP